MKVLLWAGGALLALLLLLALTGSQIRLRRTPALAVDCCDNRCSPPSYCSRRTCQCEAGTQTKDANTCEPSPPHSGIFQADWINPERPSALGRAD